MMRPAFSLLALAVAACAPKQSAADSATAAANAIDTLKPAVVAATDSPSTPTGATTKVATPTSTRTPSTGTKATTPVVARDTAHLGRDSVIKINPRDPKRMIPVEKKP